MKRFLNEKRENYTIPFSTVYQKMNGISRNHLKRTSLSRRCRYH